MAGTKEKSGGRREGAGRKTDEIKVVASWRVNKEALEIIRNAKIDISGDVNKLIKKRAKEIQLSKESLTSF